jgi:hypothetical protein
MKISIDPFKNCRVVVSSESLALAAWYDSQPAVRRLWGIRLTNLLRVVVSVEATLDNNDVLPVWLANRNSWANELSVFTRSTVKLELFDALTDDEIEIGTESVIVADLYWRDGTLNQPNEVL